MEKFTLREFRQIWQILPQHARRTVIDCIEMIDPAPRLPFDQQPEQTLARDIFFGILGCGQKIVCLELLRKNLAFRIKTRPLTSTKSRWNPFCRRACGVKLAPKSLMPARLQKNRRSCLNRHTRSNASSTSKHGRVTAPVTIEQLPPPQDVAPAAAEEVVLRLILHMLQNAQKNPRKDVRKVAAQYLQVILARLDQIEGSH